MTANVITGKIGQFQEASEYAQTLLGEIRLGQLAFTKTIHSGAPEENISAGSKTKCNTDTFIAEVLQCPRVTSI